MELTKKKETLLQNITYMALMAAINVIFVLLTTFVPILFFLIVFVLPLTSTIVTLHCKKRYFPIYAVATIGLCMIVTIWKIDDTIFYVIPSVISGFMFGFLIEKKVPSFWILLVATTLQIIFTYISIPIIQAIFGRSIVEVFATAFGLAEFPYLSYLVPCFIFFISLSQEIITYMIIREELPKLGYELNENKNVELSLCILSISFVALAIIFAFVYGPLGFMFTLYALFIGVYIIIHLILNRNIFVYIALPVSVVVSVFLFAGLYQLFDKPLGLILFNIFFFILGIIVFTNNYLSKRLKKDTIS